MLLPLMVTAVLQAVPDALDRAVEAGIADGVFPGAVAVVGTADRVLFARGYGHFTWSPASAVPDPETTRWDVASLTKVVATLPAILVLVDQGHIDLDRPIREYLPAFDGPGKDAVTVRHLLTHRSGLRAFLPLDRETANAAEARARVLAEPLRRPPGTMMEYSDLNAMILGWIVEAVAGSPLDSVATELVFRAVGMPTAGFRPSRSERSHIAPVGRWRGTPIAGELHDQNAARLDGVAGHAGLYATATDLARYAQFWLRHGRTEDGSTLFADSLWALATERGLGGRGLGWELRDTTTTDNAGRRMSTATFGHTGYTGTSLWIDPQRGFFVLLLTNRVYAPRHRRSITQLKVVRGAVADAAASLVTVCLAGGDTGRAAVGC